MNDYDDDVRRDETDELHGIERRWYDEPLFEVVGEFTYAEGDDQ